MVDPDTLLGGEVSGVATDPVRLQSLVLFVRRVVGCHGVPVTTVNQNETGTDPCHLFTAAPVA
ncbi:hypothetical protein MCNS_10550 [Mycobacterium conspicuum]|uniref:Uncharacterized protein n=1 Tax=Mycobacterium conspicuum TaxID=44010 RepID=A0A7I7YA74_9MYCO|nr:hypothetical protein MCNS_10550 [Mycobacterium conspicuum]